MPGLLAWRRSPDYHSALYLDVSCRVAHAKRMQCAMCNAQITAALGGHVVLLAEADSVNPHRQFVGANHSTDTTNEVNVSHTGMSNSYCHSYCTYEDTREVSSTRPAKPSP